MTLAILHNEQRIEQLPNRDYISFSAISSYQSCPLKFKFRYMDQLPEDAVSAALVFGGAIHNAVEFHFNELMAGNTAPDLDTLLDVYQDAWRNRDDANIRFGKGDDTNSLGSLAERMLSVFRESEFCRPGGEILGVEEQLRGGVIPLSPDLLGRIDLIVESDDNLIVTDLKTARSRWSEAQALDAGDQLLLYSELVRSLVPGKSVKLRFLIITKTKTPTIDEHYVPLSPWRLARTKQTVENVWKAISAGNFFPAPSPMNCPSCPFRSPCREWTG